MTPAFKARLVKHAQRYGADGVMVTASEWFRDGVLSLEDVLEVQTEIDKLGRTKPHLSAETRVKRLLGISDDDQEAA